MGVSLDGDLLVRSISIGISDGDQEAGISGQGSGESVYQLAFFNPGISPSRAMSLSTMRLIPNLR